MVSRSGTARGTHRCKLGTAARLPWSPVSRLTGFARFTRDSCVHVVALVGEHSTDGLTARCGQLLPTEVIEHDQPHPGRQTLPCWTRAMAVAGSMPASRNAAATDGTAFGHSRSQTRIRVLRIRSWPFHEPPPGLHLTGPGRKLTAPLPCVLTVRVREKQLGHRRQLPASHRPRGVLGRPAGQ